MVVKEGRDNITIKTAKSEVFRIQSEYFRLSKEKKLEGIQLLEKWISSEKALLEGAKNTEQQVEADEIDNMPDACKKCGNRGYDVCPIPNCQFHSLT